MLHHISVIREGEDEKSDGTINHGYQYFYRRCQMSVPDMIKAFNEDDSGGYVGKIDIEAVFGSIFQARLGLSKDNFPNYNSWKGVGGKTEFRNDMTATKSDE